MKKTALVSLLLVASVSTVFAQGGSGAPSPAGQSESTGGEASASAAVAAHHAKHAAKKAAKKKAKADKAASAASAM